MGRKSVNWNDWRVAQEESVKERYRVQSQPKHFKELTGRHKEYIKLIEDKQIVISTGPPGSGKSTLACRKAYELLESNKFRKIVLTRPLVECDEELGILPGTADEKMEMFLLSAIGPLKEMMGDKVYQNLRREERIEFVPLARMRGRTFVDTIVIAEEMQSATMRQLKMLLTRVGYNSKFLLNGDIRQSDVDGPCMMWDVMKRLAKPPQHRDIGWIVFQPEDCLRPEIVRFVDDRL